MDLRGAGLQPGIQLVAAHLNADQAVALLGLVPAAPATPAVAAAKQTLEVTAAQASSHEAMYYCTVCWQLWGTHSMFIGRTAEYGRQSCAGSIG